MSSVLDCGHALVGGRKIVQLTCKNSGGDGQFCVLRKSSWPSTTFQVIRGKIYPKMSDLIQRFMKVSKAVVSISQTFAGSI